MKTQIKTGILMMGLFFVAAGIRFAVAEIPVQNSNADILGVVAVIDQNEIQAAQLAQQKNINHKVFDYAKMLGTQHTQNLNVLQDLSQKIGVAVADNPTVENIRTKGQQDLAVLTPLDGNSFAQLYIADMVKGHSEALNWIDSQDTSDPKLKKFLRDTRDHITMHLKKAQELQSYEQ